MDSRLTAGRQFEAEIENLFKAAGYMTECNVDYSGQEFDIIATRREIRGLDNCIAVECKFRSGGTVSNQEVQEFVTAFHACSMRHGLTHGIFVSNRGFSRHAQAVAEAHRQIVLVTASALEDELLGARTYLEAAKQAYRSEFTNYIPLRAENVPMFRDKAHNVSDIAKTCVQRLSEPLPSFTVLLGDFGSGKTTIAEQVHKMLAGRFLEEQSGVFPVILYLRTLEQHDSEDNFVEAHLKPNSKDLTLERLAVLGRRNRIAFILDGFDEVAANASEEDRMRLFSRAMRIAARGHSVLLTSRPSYFNNLEELNDLVEALVEHDHAAVHALDGQILRRDRDIQAILDQNQAIALAKLEKGSFPAFSPGATAMFVVSPLRKADIVKFFEPHAAELKRRHHKTPEQVYEFLTGVYDLTDLLTRPLLLDMFVSLLGADELRFDRPDLQIGPAGLYHLYINYHLSRDWRVRRFLTPKERLAFARAAAVAMLDAGGSLEASYESVWKVVRDDETALEPDRRHLLQSNRDGVVTDVRVCAFMNVTPAGRIEFSHKSFMEYFVAEVIVSRLRDRTPINLLTKPLNYEILYFLGSYALLRADTRVELLQHLRHAGYGQSAAYRANLLIALMFSEQASHDREFSDIDYARVRIARKSFDSCRFRNVRLRHATIIATTFQNCEFDDLHIEGEMHSATFVGCKGTLLLPATAFSVAIDHSRPLRIGSGDTGARLKSAEFQDSDLLVEANLAIEGGRLRFLTLSLAGGTCLRLTDISARDAVLRFDRRVHDRRRLPILQLTGCRLQNLTLIFVSVSRDQFVDAEVQLRNCQGILVVDDLDRQLEAFKRKEKKGDPRYVGWEKSRRLLAISSEVYGRLDEAALSVLERSFAADESDEAWNPDPATRIVQDAIARAPLAWS